MADVLLFHHARGLTPGVVAFADRLRAAGHRVHTPDLYGGPVQVHGMDQDRYFAGEGDLDAAREIVEIVGPSAELYVHPGDGHPFEDSSLDSYDPDAAQLLTARVIHFLRRVDRS